MKGSRFSVCLSAASRFILHSTWVFLFTPNDSLLFFFLFQSHVVYSRWLLFHVPPPLKGGAHCCVCLCCRVPVSINVDGESSVTFRLRWETHKRKLSTTLDLSISLSLCLTKLCRQQGFSINMLQQRCLSSVCLLPRDKKKTSRGEQNTTSSVYGREESDQEPQSTHRRGESLRVFGLNSPPVQSGVPALLFHPNKATKIVFIVTPNTQDSLRYAHKATFTFSQQPCGHEPNVLCILKWWNICVLLPQPFRVGKREGR